MCESMWWIRVEVYWNCSCVVFFLDRFVAISDLYEPTDDGTESQVREFIFQQHCNYKKYFPERIWIYFVGTQPLFIHTVTIFCITFTICIISIYYILFVPYLIYLCVYMVVCVCTFLCLIAHLLCIVGSWPEHKFFIALECAASSGYDNDNKLLSLPDLCLKFLRCHHSLRDHLQRHQGHLQTYDWERLWLWEHETQTERCVWGGWAVSGRGPLERGRGQERRRGLKRGRKWRQSLQ